jgi:hypothetical protein
MKEFMMIFRQPQMPPRDIAPEEMQAAIKLWKDWIAGIAAQGKFVATNALGGEGKILKANGVITDGPYVEAKEMVGGYIIVKAGTIEEAMQLAQGCPILGIGGHVEVRDIRVMQ